MSKYTIEVQLNTSQSILMLADGVAQQFDIKGYRFTSAKLGFDKRPGHRYYVQRNVEAENMHQAYMLFMEHLMKVSGSIAYFYSQPVSVEYWNILIKKEGDDAAYFGAYKPIPATSMTDYNEIDPRLNDLIDKVETDKDLENSLWLYNNVAKIDGVDYDPSSHQFGICQLVESLSGKEEISGCEVCGRGGYVRTSRRDIEALLGSDLYSKLYGGSDILRNRLGHGQLVDSIFLSNQDVEDSILKVTERLNSKYVVENKVTQSMSDRIRGTMRWYGATYGIGAGSKCLEECLDIQFDNQRQHTQKQLDTRGW